MTTSALYRIVDSLNVPVYVGTTVGTSGMQYMLYHDVMDSTGVRRVYVPVVENADKTAEKAPAENTAMAEPEMDAPQFTTFGSAPKEEEVKAEAPKETHKDLAVRDEDIILFGSCKGMKYGDAKYTASFASFIKSVKTHVSLRFPDAERTKQLEFFRNLGESYGTNQRS